MLLDLLLLAGTGAVVAGSAYLPVAAEPPPRPTGVPAIANGQFHPKLRPLADYRVIYERRLRAPLFDPAPAPPVVPTPPPEPRLTARLVGTAVDRDFSYAIFQMSTGENRAVSVGQTIEEAMVLAIRDDSVTLKFHGKEIVLGIQEAAPPTRPLPGRGLPFRPQVPQPK